jgi:hypothetical protein
MTKTVNIPSPIITDVCEWFILRTKKVSPTVDPNWTTLPTNYGNDFTLTLADDSVFQIEATHHCCDGSNSTPLSVLCSTATSLAPIYVKMLETPLSDTCAVTAGTCRNCAVTHNFKLYFYKDSTLLVPVDVTGLGLIIQAKLTLNSGFSSIATYAVYGTSYNIDDIVVYEENCDGFGFSTVLTRNVEIQNGLTLAVPYSYSPAGLVNGTITYDNASEIATYNSPSISGKILASAGTSVKVRFSTTGVDPNAQMNGSINGISFFVNNATPYIARITMPPSGTIIWASYLSSSAPINPEAGQIALL